MIKIHYNVQLIKCHPIPKGPRELSLSRIKFKFCRLKLIRRLQKYLWEPITIELDSRFVNYSMIRIVRTFTNLMRISYGNRRLAESMIRDKVSDMRRSEEQNSCF